MRVCVCVCEERDSLSHIYTDLQAGNSPLPSLQILRNWPCQLPMKRWSHGIQVEPPDLDPQSYLEKDWATKRDGKIQHCGLKPIKGVSSSCLIFPLSQLSRPISTPSLAWGALSHSLHTLTVPTIPPDSRHSASSTKSLLNAGND